MTLLPMISYAQNGEDVLLRRALPGKKGFYVDVGAGYPSIDSVTKYFYNIGWTGINIEPQSQLFELMQTNRPKDTNVNCAVGSREGKAELLTFENAWGWATLNKEVADKVDASTSDAKKVEVELLSLDSILEKHAKHSEIDFLKIDVEGNEADVLLSIDLTRWQPKIIVVEATAPNSTRQTHDEWESILIDGNYTYAFFDGLNRYYVKEKYKNLVQDLSIPPNEFDKYAPLKWWHQIPLNKQKELIDQQEKQNRDMSNFHLYIKQREEIQSEFEHSTKREH